jgi:hypothetical protein
VPPYLRKPTVRDRIIGILEGMTVGPSCLSVSGVNTGFGTRSNETRMYHVPSPGIITTGSFLHHHTMSILGFLSALYSAQELRVRIWPPGFSLECYRFISESIVVTHYLIVAELRTQYERPLWCSNREENVGIWSS